MDQDLSQEQSLTPPPRFALASEKPSYVQVFNDLEEAFRVFDNLDEEPEEGQVQFIVKNQDFAEVDLPPIPPESEVTQYLLRNALLLVDAGEFTLARNVLGDLLKRDPGHVEGIRWMGWCFKSEGDFVNALKCYERLAQRRCTEQDLFELGEIYYLLKRDADAQITWLEALGQCDAESPRLFDLHKSLGNVFMRQGDFDSAEENYNKAMILKTNSDVLHVNFGSLQMQLKDYGKAMHYFKKAIEINPYNDRAWCGVALVAREKNDIEWSRAVLLRSLDINPSNLTALQVLISWAQMDSNFDAAIARTQSYLGEHPESADLTYSLAGLYFQCDSLKDAELTLDKLSVLKPDYAGTEELRTLIHKKLEMT